MIKVVLLAIQLKGYAYIREKIDVMTILDLDSYYLS